jgi:hypothetical protein
MIPYIKKDNRFFKVNESFQNQHCRSSALLSDLKTNQVTRGYSLGPIDSSTMPPVSANAPAIGGMGMS